MSAFELKKIPKKFTQHSYFVLRTSHGLLQMRPKLSAMPHREPTWKRLNFISEGMSQAMLTLFHLAARRAAGGFHCLLPQLITADDLIHKFIIFCF